MVGPVAERFVLRQPAAAERVFGPRCARAVELGLERHVRDVIGAVLFNGDADIPGCHMLGGLIPDRDAQCARRTGGHHIHNRVKRAVFGLDPRLLLWVEHGHGTGLALRGVGAKNGCVADRDFYAVHLAGVIHRRVAQAAAIRRAGEPDLCMGSVAERLVGGRAATTQRDLGLAGQVRLNRALQVGRVFDDQRTVLGRDDFREVGHGFGLSLGLRTVQALRFDNQTQKLSKTAEPEIKVIKVPGKKLTYPGKSTNSR